VSDALTRVILAAGLSIVIGFGLVKLHRIPRDVALTIFGGSVAILGIFAFFGVLPAVIGGAVIVGVCVGGVAVYGLLSLMTRGGTH